MRLRITRAGPLATVQDEGRPGMLRHGIAASGPMDRSAFRQCGAAIGAASTAGLEFTRAGLAVVLEGGPTRMGVAGGAFSLRRNGLDCSWPCALDLQPGDAVDITPGPAGNYGYLRFSAEIDVPVVMGSRSTSSIAGLGGFAGRALRAGDMVPLVPMPGGPSQPIAASERDTGAIRILWGVHADLFAPKTRERFLASGFEISGRLDRMGVRLVDSNGVFSEMRALSLVSEAVFAGDIQILGDGTPVVLMRDHQPTGGYPRIATVITADFDRFAQLLPGTEIRFAPVSLESAQRLLASALL